MDAILQMPFSRAFSCMKMYEFRLRFHWSLFLRFELTTFQHCGVWQNDWETRRPHGNYSTASDTWIQASTNKMPAPDYACWRSNNSHCDVIMSRLWLWWSWRPHNLRFRKAQCISSSAAWCGRPKIGPSREKQQNVAGSRAGYRIIIRLVCEVYHPERKGMVGQWLQPYHKPHECGFKKSGVRQNGRGVWSHISVYTASRTWARL